jgi:hypothetical protein
MPVAKQDYLSNMGLGSNKISMYVTYPASARVLNLRTFEQEGTMQHLDRNKILVIYANLPSKTHRANNKGP